MINNTPSSRLFQYPTRFPTVKRKGKSEWQANSVDDTVHKTRA